MFFSDMGTPHHGKETVCPLTELPPEVVALISEHLDFKTWKALSSVDDRHVPWIVNPVRLPSITMKRDFIVNPENFCPSGPELRTDFSWYAVPSSIGIKKAALEEQERRMGNKERVRFLINLIQKAEQSNECKRKMKRTVARAIITNFSSRVTPAWRKQMKTMLELSGPQRLEDVDIDQPSKETYRWLLCSECRRYYPYPRPQVLYSFCGDEYYIDFEGMNLLYLLGYRPSVEGGTMWTETRFDLYNDSLELSRLGCRHWNSIKLRRLQDKKALLEMCSNPRKMLPGFMSMFYPDYTDMGRQPIGSKVELVLRRMGI